MRVVRERRKALWWIDDVRRSAARRRIELGVVTAEGVWQWARALARTASGNPERSPFVHLTSGRKFKVDFSRAVDYEMDGGERQKTKRLKVKVEPAAITVCVPDTATG